MSVTLTVRGRPVSKGSMRTILANRKGGKKYPVTVHNNQEGIARYASDIRVEYEKAIGLDHDPTPEPKGVPMMLRLTFQFRRPQVHYNAKGELKGASYKAPAPLYHTQDPDIDKLCRSVMDALKGLAYDDDNQVVRLDPVKRWGEEDLTLIEVGRADGH